MWQPESEHFYLGRSGGDTGQTERTASAAADSPVRIKGRKCSPRTPWRQKRPVGAFEDSRLAGGGRGHYLICWLASLRIFSTSLPLSSSSLVRVLMFSLRVWIWRSSWAMWFFLRDTSSCSSVILPSSSRSCKDSGQEWATDARWD